MQQSRINELRKKAEKLLENKVGIQASLSIQDIDELAQAHILPAVC